MSGMQVILALGLVAVMLPAALAVRMNPSVDGSMQQADNIKPPVFPDVYVIEFNISMPHFYLTQPQGLSVPYKIWFDGPNAKKRVDVFGGMNTIYDISGAEYTVFPRLDKLECGSWVPGPVRDGADAAPLEKGKKAKTFLPDLEGWAHGGTADIDGKTADIWTFQTKVGDKVSQYTFYTGQKDGAPLKFHMIGVNFLTNSHADEYIYDFFSYSTKMEAHEDDLFTPPEICNKPSSVLTTRSVRSFQIRSMLPSMHAPRDAHLAPYSAWAAQQGREFSSEAELRTRADLFTTTAKTIAAHNTNPARAYKMKLNKYADWTEEEFVSIMLPNQLTKKERMETIDAKKPESYKPLGVFKRKLKRKDLPREVDWRGTGADPGVKDQGMCGSCFAFGATGSMDGVWYVSTGQHRSFSEQQIIDCSWNYGPNGCAGGDFQPVFNFIAENGGLALEQDYPYKSNNDFCQADKHDKPGKFKGFLQIESRDEAAVMEAVYTLGPLAVGVDASLNSFRYYSEGIYSPEECKIASAELDHAVVLFGYGTTAEGVDYWLVRNSWAKYYGDDGYVKIGRGKKMNDCGISSDATVAVVADEALVEGADRRILSAVRKWN